MFIPQPKDVLDGCVLLPSSCQDAVVTGTVGPHLADTSRPKSPPHTGHILSVLTGRNQVVTDSVINFVLYVPGRVRHLEHCVVLNNGPMEFSRNRSIPLSNRDVSCPICFDLGLDL